MYKSSPQLRVFFKLGPAVLPTLSQGRCELVEPCQFPPEQVARETFAHPQGDHQRHHQYDKNGNRCDGCENLGEQ
ncbi:hypothetical protein K3758_12040 [Sulfitobacter sp. W002]|uniref:hypothetical protein n=1 Tax=Sulfitobacter sp. W002 TaxID=2867024 RepID=UPI0021A69440|nr:hypothetical protein [Sulfitobacter sp. W002]UWR29092.1 hypothetical protein K3758_12040 [Sulfitobacter sp. W002]